MPYPALDTDSAETPTESRSETGDSAPFSPPASASDSTYQRAANPVIRSQDAEHYSRFQTLLASSRVKRLRKHCSNMSQVQRDAEGMPRLPGMRLLHSDRIHRVMSTEVSFARSRARLLQELQYAASSSEPRDLRANDPDHFYRQSRIFLPFCAYFNVFDFRRDSNGVSDYSDGDNRQTRPSDSPPVNQEFSRHVLECLDPLSYREMTRLHIAHTHSPGDSQGMPMPMPEAAAQSDETDDQDNPSRAIVAPPDSPDNQTRKRYSNVPDFVYLSEDESEYEYVSEDDGDGSEIVRQLIGGMHPQASAAQAADAVRESEDTTATARRSLHSTGNSSADSKPGETAAEPEEVTNRVSDLYGSSETGNGSHAGIQMDFSDSFRSLSDRMQWAVKKQPGDRFPDAVNGTYLGHQKIGLGRGCKFKNNLTVFSAVLNAHIVAVNSELLFYGVREHLRWMDLHRFESRPIDDPFDYFPLVNENIVDIGSQVPTRTPYPIPPLNASAVARAGSPRPPELGTEGRVASGTAFHYQPNDLPILKINTRPERTSRRDTMVATWSYFPHTINYLKIGYFLDREVLIAVKDDGYVFVWYTRTFNLFLHNMHLRQAATNRMSDLFGLHIKPDFILKVGASAWGVDVYNEKNMIVVSDNSPVVTLFYYSTEDLGSHGQVRNTGLAGGSFYVCKTNTLLDNIPSVTFIRDDVAVQAAEQRQEDIRETLHTIVYVSAVTIGEEVLVIAFELNKVFGPMPQDEMPCQRLPRAQRGPTSCESAHQKHKRVLFKLPEIVSRTMLGEHGWTTTFVPASMFKEVTSLAAASGDPWLRQDDVLERIAHRNEIMNLSMDSRNSDTLGLAAGFEHLEVPVLDMNYVQVRLLSRLTDFQSPGISQQSNGSQEGDESASGSDSESEESSWRPRGTRESAGHFGSKSDQIRRIKKSYDAYYLKQQRGKIPDREKTGQSQWEFAPTTPFMNQFLVVTSEKRVALFRVNKLVCSASTKSLFHIADADMPYGGEMHDVLLSDRLSIVKLIPQLSAIVVVSQAGLVSLFRLTRYRDSAFAMRQELVFPDHRMFMLSDRGYRTIIGLTVVSFDEVTGQYNDCELEWERQTSLRRFSPQSCGHEADFGPRRFFLHLTYSDGLLLSYELRTDTDTGDISLDDIVL